MRIVLDIPDLTVCGFFNYVYYTNTGPSMAVRQIGTDEMRDNNLIKVDPKPLKGADE